MTPNEFAAFFEGKTIKNLRPNHDQRVPRIDVLLTNKKPLRISVLDGVFFEGALVNCLRRAGKCSNVMYAYGGNRSHVVELRAFTFPMLQLMAVNQGPDLKPTDFPFVVEEIPYG